MAPSQFKFLLSNESSLHHVGIQARKDRENIKNMCVKSGQPSHVIDLIATASSSLNLG